MRTDGQPNMLWEGIIRCAVTTATTSSMRPNVVAPTPSNAPEEPYTNLAKPASAHHHPDRRPRRCLPLLALHPARTARPTPSTDPHARHGQFGTPANRARIRRLATTTAHPRPRTHSRTRPPEPSTPQSDRPPTRPAPRQPHHQRPRHGHRPRRKHPGHAPTAHPARDNVGLLEIPHFPLKFADPLLLSSRGTRPLGGIHLSLQHPAAQRLRADLNLRADRLQAAYTDRYSLR